MRTRLVAALAAFLLAASAAEADVSAYLGRRVSAVRIESDGRAVTDRRMLDLIEVRADAPLVMADVRESILHLFSLGQYEDVRARAAAAGDGVVLTFELVPQRPIGTVAFTGASAGIDLGRLRRIVTDQFGPSPRPGRAADIARVVEDHLKQRGYLHPAVTFRIETGRTRTRSALIFDLAPGPRARIGRIDVRGDPGVPLSNFLRDLRVSTGAPFERDALNVRIDRYRDERRDRGFLAARLSVAAQSTDGDRTVDLTFNAAQGPRVRVEFKGDPLRADRRDDLVPVAREGSADEDLLEDSTNRIEEYLRAQGYRDAAAPHTREETDNELLITFTVTKGIPYRVDRIEISGNAALSSADLEAHLRVRPGQPFSVAALERDVSYVEEVYRREGFAAARVDATVEVQHGAPAAEALVVIRIAVVEHVRTVVGSVVIEGNQFVSEPDLRQSLRLRAGRPFLAADLAVDREALQLRYANLGYQSAAVTAVPGLSADGARADVVFRVREGRRTFVDHVLIGGNQRTRTSTIERELQFRPGDPLGLDAINESQRRLVALGLFRRARITELGHGDETRRDVLVTVEEAPVTTIGYGGGIEAAQLIRRSAETDGVASERLEFAPRAFLELGRRNLFGKNRSINLFTRISLRPKDSPYFQNRSSSSPTGSGYAFSEYRVIGTFREPRVLGTSADAFLTGTVEQQIRSSFNFARRAFGAEVGRRLTRHVSVSGNYQIQRTELFDEKFNRSEQLLVDRLFPQVRLSSFSSSVIRDTRDDAIDPATGHYTSANVQVAARRIGSEVGLAKTYLTGQMFRTLPRSRRIVFGGSARLGMAAGFTGDPVDGSGADTGQPQVVASERFFAGGDTTVRGFSLDQLGAPETIDKDGFPIGGDGLVIFNAELRIPLRGGIGVVGFFDAGNVFARTSDINLGELRSAVGFGVRYKSPIGPIRVDIGFKTHRQEIVAGRLESPSAVHISLGQAF